MKLTFIGTRGEIEARTELHFRHTSLLVEYRWYSPDVLHIPDRVEAVGGARS